MPETAMSDEHKDVARRRAEECTIEADALQEWLWFLGKLNWVTVVLPVVLSAFAGTAIFAGIVNDWKIWAGLASFLSSVIVIVHKTKKCDAHQSECGRLVKAYRGLATRYRSFADVGADDPDSEIRTLEATLASINETANARAPEKIRRKVTVKQNS